jgi:hypothetical protein
MIIKKAMSCLFLISCILMQAVTLNEIMPPSAESADRVMQKVQEVSQTDKMKKMELECREKVQAAIEVYATELAEDVVRELQPEDARSLDQLMVRALVFMDYALALSDELTEEEQVLMGLRWMELMSLFAPYDAAFVKQCHTSKQDHASVRIDDKDRIVWASVRSLVSKIKSSVERAANR